MVSNNFPQLSLIAAPKLAETLVFSRSVLKGARAYQFIRDRLDPTPPGESTFYEWRPLALVAPRRGRYDPIDLLYLEIFGLHLRQWDSREDASQAVKELFGWQQEMEALHLHPIDSALLLGGAMKRFSMAVDEAAETVANSAGKSDDE